MFKLEAVTTCVEFDDYLAESLHRNKAMIDRLVVVTAPEDLRTQRICEWEHVQCILTDDFESRWGEFHKGAGINVGLDELDLDGWVIHLDADIVLPPQTRNLLQAADLDPTMVYGCDRFMVPNAGAWRDHCALPKLQQEDDVYVHTGAFPLGTRIATSTYGGYVPIGFAQVWNPDGSGVRTYPEEHTSAGRGDMLFAGQWPRAKRACLPELIVYHLQSGHDKEQGEDWSGRMSARFGAPAGPPAVEQLPRHRKRHRHHHHHHHHHDYGIPDGGSQ